MESHPPLSDLVDKTLQEIGKLGLSTERNRDYRLVYKRFEAFAKTRDEERYSPDLLRSFLADTAQRYRDGVIGRARRNHLRRSALLLKDYLESERIEWRVYPPETARPKPSEKFRFLHGQYLESLKSEGKSQNTIESARNQIGQFLVFLDESGYHTLSEAPLTIVLSFFQHLLARYRPTTMHMVAYNLRTFLKFVEGGERLLPLVPSRCLRSRPIIPVLSDQEHTALKRTLEGPVVALRDKAIIQLAFRTGLRSVDIARMKLSDIDWVTDSILVTQSKTGRPLRIPLTADVGNLLSAYILTERPQANTPYVFLRFQAPYRPFSGHSSCYGVLRRVFARARIRVGGERKGFNVLRHSVASRMLSRGVPVTTIASALGHANKASTEVYLATDEGRMRECALPLPELSTNIGG